MKVKKNFYFGKREEQAVLDYISAKTKEEKDRIYNEILLVPFRKMIQSILRKYPIHIGNYSIEDVESSALSHLIDQMVKFNPDAKTKKGGKTKAYSYCQTIIRNYYKDWSKRTYIEKKTNIPFDSCINELENDVNLSYEIDEVSSHYYDNLIKIIVSKIEVMINTNKNLKKNEIIVGDAIINILKNWQVLFLEETPEGVFHKKVTNKFQKNKILFFLKEQTGLSTKEIRVAMKPFKEMYYIEKLNIFNK